MTVYVYALDVDSAMSPGEENPQYNKGQAIDAEGYLIEAHETMFLSTTHKLHQHIVEEMKAKSAAHVVLKSFSARQSWRLDIANALNNNNHVSPPLFNSLRRYLEIRLPAATVKFNDTLLADIHRRKHDRLTFKEMEQRLQELRSTNSNNKPNRDGYADTICDITKVILLYFIAHQIASLYPHEKIVLNIFDDRIDILATLYEFYNKNRDLLPHNLSLRIYQSIVDRDDPNAATLTTNKENKDSSLFPTLQGSGPIDKDYTLGTLELAQFAYPEQKLKAGDSINVGPTYIERPDFLTKFKKTRKLRLHFFAPFLQCPWQAILTGLTIGVCCFFMITAFGVTSLAAFLLSVLIGGLNIPFSHPTITIRNFIAEYGNTGKGVALVISLLSSIILLIMIPYIPLVVTLGIAAAISYFFVLPTLSACWKNVVTYIKNCQNNLQGSLDYEFTYAPSNNLQDSNTVMVYNRPLSPPPSKPSIELQQWKSGRETKPALPDGNQEPVSHTPNIANSSSFLAFPAVTTTSSTKIPDHPFAVPASPQVTLTIS